MPTTEQRVLPRLELDSGRDPQQSARRLGRELRSLPSAEQTQHLDRLLEQLLQRHHAYGIALFLLETVTSPECLRSLGRHLSPLPELQSADQEGHLADLIRIVAAANDRSMLKVVESYLIDREMSPQWSTVPWALWPHRRTLFARAFKRFFVEQDPTHWRNTLLIKSFLAEPAAIRSVRRALIREAPSRWRELQQALIRQAGHASWLSADQRSALQAALR